MPLVKFLMTKYEFNYNVRSNIKLAHRYMEEIDTEIELMDEEMENKEENLSYAHLYGEFAGEIDDDYLDREYRVKVRDSHLRNFEAILKFHKKGLISSRLFDRYNKKYEEFSSRIDKYHQLSLESRSL